MPVTPKLLFEAAKALGRGKSEVDQRNAASRAYYAAYHRCLPIAESIGLSGETKGVHRNLIDTLTTTRDIRVKSMGYMLDQCRSLRVKADYEIHIEFSAENARLVMSQCERIMSKADALDPDGAN